MPGCRSCCLVLLLTVGASAAEIPFAELFDPKSRKPEDLAWSPDSQRLAYRFDDGAGDKLWLFERAGATSAPLLTLEGEGAQLLELESLRWAPDGQSFVTLAAGDLHRFEIATRKLERLTSTPDAEEDPKFSPDGTRLAYVRQGNLYVRTLADGAETALTTDGDGETHLNGETDWVYWEELWNRESTGYWWSPDSRRLAFYHFDESAVDAYPLVDENPVYPAVKWQRYPKAGGTNPTVRVGVVSAAGGEVRWLATGDPAAGYLARVHWMAAGRVAVEHLDREQTRLTLLSCAADDGSCEELLVESAATWVNVGDETTFLPDGSFLWSSERSGWKEIYLYDGDGKLRRQLSAGAGHVTSLDAVLEERGEIVYTRYQPGFMGAKDRQVERVRLADGRREVLTSGAGWHEAEVADDGTWVHGWSDADHPGRWIVRAADGSQLGELPRQAPGFDPATLPAWEFLTIPGPRGVELPARLLRPAGFDGAGKVPAIVYHYGGPQSQVVMNRWDGRSRDVWHKWMASRGYAVFMVDNEISDFFGKTGGDLTHRKFGPHNLEAQLAAVAYLGGLGWVDVERLGLWGWSGGGTNTLEVLLKSPGTFRAGVAGAPVTDWRFYDSIWTERYLDHPETNPEGYRLSSPLTSATALRDGLLIVHGTGDDNVHPQNTLVFIEALIEAGLPFEDAIYPRQKHGFKDRQQDHFLRRMTEFFDRWLRPELKPR